MRIPAVLDGVVRSSLKHRKVGHLDPLVAELRLRLCVVWAACGGLRHKRKASKRRRKVERATTIVTEGAMRALTPPPDPALRPSRYIFPVCMHTPGE